MYIIKMLKWLILLIPTIALADFDLNRNTITLSPDNQYVSAIVEITSQTNTKTKILVYVKTVDCKRGFGDFMWSGTSEIPMVPILDRVRIFVFGETSNADLSAVTLCNYFENHNQIKWDN